MCVIAYQPAGVEMSGNKFRNCWSRNKDGGGLSYVDDGELVIKKGYFEMTEMLDDYRTLRKAHEASPFIIHMRIATMGAVDGDNTHPFWVRDDLVMAHNGTIRGFGNKEMSDSYDFATTVLRTLQPGWEDDETIRFLVERAINYDKMVLMRADTSAYILNEDAGDWVDGLWYSNASYKKPVKYKAVAPYVAKPANGNSLAVVPSADVYEGIWDDDFYWQFIGEDCLQCDEQLTIQDVESCEEVDATAPVCEKCIVGQYDALVNQGVIAEVFDPATSPATSALDDMDALSLFV